MTALNQADHCIVALPQAGDRPAADGRPAEPGARRGVLPRQFKEPGVGLWQFLVQVVAANANQLGGTLPENSFTSGEFAMLPQHYAAQSIATVSSTQIATTKMYQFEAMRLSDKLGANNPKAVAMTAQAYAGAQTARLMAIQAEAATIAPPTASDTTAAVSVRLVNAKGQGLEGYTSSSCAQMARGSRRSEAPMPRASSPRHSTRQRPPRSPRRAICSSRSPTRPERKSPAPRTRSRSILAPTSARR